MIWEQIVNKFYSRRGEKLMGSKERFYVDIMALQPEVTGSCNLVIVNYPNGSKTRFVVDCGLFQESGYSEYNGNFPFNAENVEFCVITHNHVDHTGRLPLLVKQGFKGKIYVSKDTNVLLPLALEDSYKVLKDVAKRNNAKQLYSETDVSETLKRVIPLNFAGKQKDSTELEFEETVTTKSNIKITMFKNGHLIGAAIVLIQIQYEGYETIYLEFTGDYNKNNSFLEVPELPKAVKKLPLTIIQESTYGTTNSDEVVECFEKNVLECIQNGGTVVNMAFSLGRFQEILYKLKIMQDEGKLSTNIPIYADGKLGLRYTELFSKGKLDIRKETIDFLPENLCFVSKDNRAEILESEDCKIIVTTSGMGTYGPAPQYIIKYIKQPKSLIQFTGFTTEGTLGARLKNAENGDVVPVGGMFAVKRAKVEYTTEFSAHAKANEMISFLKQFENLKLVLVNHGETTVKESFAKRIVQEVKVKDVGILGRQYLYRVGHYGFIKTMSTKFE